MREKVFGLLVAVGLIGCAALLPAAGQEEQSASAADSAGAAMAGEIPDLEHGYYNIDEYQRLTGREITGFSESPMLGGRGLPPVAERLPDNPLVMIPLEQVGRYGGTLRAPNFRPNAHVHMHLFNSFRLIHQPPYGAGGIYWFAGPRLWRAQPGVFESWDKSADGRTHTYTIREGLKWSDGVPVTTEDIAYAFNHDFMNSGSARLAACLDALAGDGRRGHGEPGDRRPVHLQVRLRPSQSQLSRRYRHRT